MHWSGIDQNMAGTPSDAPERRQALRGWATVQDRLAHAGPWLGLASLHNVAPPLWHGFLMSVGKNDGMIARVGRGKFLAPLAALTLSACGGSFIPPPATTSTRPVAPLIKDDSGVIGADTRSLIRMFGEPRLDIRDPSAQKLQFSNARCVLDVYLYPPRSKREPVATYAEARTPVGDPVDWSSCASQLRKR